MMTTESKRSDPKRSQGARVASVARKAQRAQRDAERSAPRSLSALAREMGATYVAR